MRLRPRTCCSSGAQRTRPTLARSLGQRELFEPARGCIPLLGATAGALREGEYSYIVPELAVFIATRQVSSG